MDTQAALTILSNGLKVFLHSISFFVGLLSSPTSGYTGKALAVIYFVGGVAFFWNLINYILTSRQSYVMIFRVIQVIVILLIFLFVISFYSVPGGGEATWSNL